MPEPFKIREDASSPVNDWHRFSQSDKLAYKFMNDAIKQESFESLPAYQVNLSGLVWPSVFVLPGFLKSWWQAFHDVNAELYLVSVWQDGKTIGIAPLQIKEKVASFIGNADVSDYIDFITVPGKEAYFFNTLLDDLRQRGVAELDLGPIRPDSSVMTSLMGIAKEHGYEVLCQKEDVFLEMALPSGWDEYLEMLDTKQRHELRRKIKRLLAAGSMDYRILGDKDAIAPAFDTFLKLFVRSRGRKATFMTDKMVAFFRELTLTTADAGLMKFGVLRLPPAVLAMVMCFDYHDTIYLYNSAYDPDYSTLSPGILSKAFCIRDSIEKGKKIFDFLKGSEDYKYHMGGKETDIYRCHIVMR